MVQNGIFWTIGEQSYFGYYPIISYLRIKVYRVETMDMEIYHCNNGVSRKVLISILISTIVPIVKYKILWQDSFYDLCLYVESYVE